MGKDGRSEEKERTEKRIFDDWHSDSREREWVEQPHDPIRRGTLAFAAS